MAELIQTAVPIIPVIDERLACGPTAPNDHKAKVEQYNELLEDIYQREVELSRIKLSLVDMREEITEEARRLDGTSGLALAVLESTKSESESDDSAEQVLSDSSSDKGRREAKKGAKKIKGKAKGSGSRRSKVPDAQLDVEWDYRLELGRSSNRGRRASDASEADLRV